MRILVGVCGGVAAYKAAELVRLLQSNHLDVEVAMTGSAERFVTPLTFASLTGRRVHTSLWQTACETEESSDAAFAIDHIKTAQAIDAVVIAPATANLLAKLAHGIADDFLTTLCLATKAPVLIAPAMNVNMWEHPATQANVQLLEQRGVHFIAPEDGYLACGMTGSGRLATVERIAEAVFAMVRAHSALAGETVLITAGGTREPIDPVRFLGNRSSGKMGHALADAAVARGADVILVTASSLPAPASCRVERVVTSNEMSEAVFASLPAATIMIQAAAVSDFRLRQSRPSKLKRSGPLTLDLEPTEDIVYRAAARRSARTMVVAFAAETENLEQNARAKLLRKGVDAIVANDVSVAGIGFESEQNAGLFLTRDATVALPLGSKRQMAERIVDEILSLRKSFDQRVEKIVPVGDLVAFS